MIHILITLFLHHPRVGTSNAQDRAQGIVRLYRRITSDNVKDYADHIPRDVVSLDRNEEIVVMRGVVTQSSGVTTINMVPKVIPPIDDKYNIYRHV